MVEGWPRQLILQYYQHRRLLINTDQDQELINFIILCSWVSSHQLPMLLINNAENRSLQSRGRSNCITNATNECRALPSFCGHAVSVQGGDEWLVEPVSHGAFDPFPDHHSHHQPCGGTAVPCAMLHQHQQRFIAATATQHLQRRQKNDVEHQNTWDTHMWRGTSKT